MRRMIDSDLMIFRYLHYDLMTRSSPKDPDMRVHGTIDQHILAASTRPSKKSRLEISVERSCMLRRPRERLSEWLAPHETLPNLARG